MRLFFSIVLCCCSWIWVCATPNYAFTPVDVNNGLSGNQVRNIAQLPDGRMAIITQGLVNIYDGAKFKYLHYNQQNSLKLSGYTGFHHTYMGTNGYMWLKNYHQLLIIDVNHERFVSSPNHLLQSLGIKQSISDFFMDRDHRMWIITGSDDLYYLTEGQTKAKLFTRQVSQLPGSADQVYDVAVLSQKLYLFYRSGILVCFDMQSGKELYRQQSLSTDQRSKYGATSFVIPAKHQFFQLRNGTGGGAMLSYDFAQKKWTTILQTGKWLNYLSVGLDGNIWVSGNEGMWRFDANLTRKEFIPQLRLVEGQIISTEVSTIFHDNQGGMWLGTINRGLLYYHPNRFKFKNVGKSIFQLPDGTTLNVTAFAEFGNGSILVGTLQGLFIYNEHTGGINRLPAGSNMICTALFRDKQDGVWIGTHTQGLFYIDATQKIHAYAAAPRAIQAIAAHTDSTLILSTSGAGFGMFNKQTGVYHQEEVSKAVAYKNIYQTVSINKTLLASICPGGFFIYNTQTRKIEFKPDNKDYNAIWINRNKQIWLGSQDGLQLWDVKMRKIRSFYTTDGLVNNFIQSILQTPDGAIWVSTSGGLTRIQLGKEANGKITYSFSGFNRFDGVIANEFWARAAYKAPNGSLYWGGTDGFNVLPVSNGLIPKPQAPPLFVDFLLFNKEVKSGVRYNGNVILKDVLLHTRNITLKHDQNFFSLEFSALNYVNPTQTYYRYQLIGVDEKEQELKSANGNGRFSYTNVGPGTYYFKVRSADNNSNWQNNYTEIKIIVKAPLWQTGWAYLIYVVFTVGAIVVSIRYYINKKRTKLIREQKEKLDHMKAAFFMNVNAEIKEPLTQIINPLNKILKHTDEGRLKLQLKEIQNNALDLQDLVSQLSKDVFSPVEAAENELNMDVLLLNMRRLLTIQEERKQHQEEKVTKVTDTDSLLTAADEKLLQRALTYVQNNINNPAYTVELLSRDMGMDRTGLYRKLVHIIGKTPTTFIRSVRLKRASQLLEDGLTVAEVADQVGFNTSSYLTKCFQEEFGMTPSQYIASLKQPKNATTN
ncbi:helix-turn-helix domain-containing protein [Mucilaginibacter sp. CSA2-8R]|uniref:helix-turn-helix domain-containing protein n=1 Tax=Mucilaginibacter sp. CSA2-8R TaxID=3141542 RepID=UPI00315CB0B4